MRVGLAALAGLAVGLTVDALSNAALEFPFDVRWPPNLTGFWGLLYGSFATVVSFGLALWFFSRRRSRASRMGHLIAALALGLFGLAVVWWIPVVGAPSLFSLEGSWIYPLAVIPLIGSAALVRSFRRSRASTAGEPTEAQGRWSSDLYR
jgi:hypothetical protein